MGEEYTIETNGNTLTFRTRSFRAEQPSMLHSGIYNRELTSSLAAGACIVAFFSALVVVDAAVSAAYIAVAVAMFTVLFVLFRQLVFREEFLELVFDRAGEMATVVKKRFIKKAESFGLFDISEVVTRQVVISPDNPDGIAFVEKIAVQHGTAIPGFGDEKRFTTVALALKEGRSIMVFSSEQEAEAQEVADKLRKSLGARDA